MQPFSLSAYQRGREEEGETATATHPIGLILQWDTALPSLEGMVIGMVIVFEITFTN